MWRKSKSSSSWKTASSSSVTIAATNPPNSHIPMPCRHSLAQLKKGGVDHHLSSEREEHSQKATTKVARIGNIKHKNILSKCGVNWRDRNLEKSINPNWTIGTEEKQPHNINKTWSQNSRDQKTAKGKFRLKVESWLCENYWSIELPESPGKGPRMYV